MDRSFIETALRLNEVALDIDRTFHAHIVRASRNTDKPEDRARMIKTLASPHGLSVLTMIWRNSEFVRALDPEAKFTAPTVARLGRGLNEELEMNGDPEHPTASEARVARIVHAAEAFRLIRRPFAPGKPLPIEATETLHALMVAVFAGAAAGFRDHF